MIWVELAYKDNIFYTFYQSIYKMKSTYFCSPNVSTNSFIHLLRQLTTIGIFLTVGCMDEHCFNHLRVNISTNSYMGTTLYFFNMTLAFITALDLQNKRHSHFLLGTQVFCLIYTQIILHLLDALGNERDPRALG